MVLGVPWRGGAPGLVPLCCGAPGLAASVLRALAGAAVVVLVVLLVSDCLCVSAYICAPGLANMVSSCSCV